jgi:hypothetical protein
MIAFFQKLKNPSVVFFVCVFAVSVAVALLSKPYFTDRVFYINQDMYRLFSQQDEFAEYRSGSGDPVVVRIADERNRTVSIGRESYAVANTSAAYSISYRVAYPSGHQYDVQDNNRFLVSLDDKGEFVPEIAVYAGSERIDKPAEAVYPSALVTAAYPVYHFTRGHPGFLFLALAVLVFGWCSFRYERFQTFSFYLSPRRLMYNDPEPSDFYYFMCKVGGLLTMALSIWIASKAFGA